MDEDKIDLTELEYEVMLDKVEWKCDQSPLIGYGTVIHKSYDGNPIKIGDMVDVTENDGTVRRGILVLILDQGICLLSDLYWMQIHASSYKLWKWEVLRSASSITLKLM